MFTHDVIGPDDIRLLHAQQDHESGLLQFSLKHYSRSEAPPDAALSYTWGNEAASERILLDDRQLIIRPNLHRCLSHVTQERADGKAWKCLWIDAICINQHNPSEKNDQVRRMSETFKNAYIVIAWLGSNSREGDDFSRSNSHGTEWDVEGRCRFRGRHAIFYAHVDHTRTGIRSGRRCSDGRLPTALKGHSPQSPDVVDDALPSPLLLGFGNVAGLHAVQTVYGSTRSNFRPTRHPPSVRARGPQVLLPRL